MRRDLNIPVTTSKLLFILKYVATLNSFVATRSVHQVSVTCRDFVSLSGLETLSFSVATFITLLRQNFFIHCLNRLFQVAIISVATGAFMSRHGFCLLFLLVLQHKLICRNILPVLIFNFLLRHKIPCRDIISAFFLFLVSRQGLLCRDKFPLVLTSD